MPTGYTGATMIGTIRRLICSEVSIRELLSSNDSEVLEPRTDVLNRFEREIDLQYQLLNDIDNKAEHITKLVGILIGLVLTALSLSLDPNGNPPSTSLPVLVSFGIGLVALAMTMGAGIWTYLSSKIRLGLHPSVAETIQSIDLTSDYYSTLAMNTYASIIEQNKEVLDVNSSRLKVTLTSLLIGVFYLSLAIVMFLGIEGQRLMWEILAVGTAAIGYVSYYLLRGRYLTIQDEE